MNRGNLTAAGRVTAVTLAAFGALAAALALGGPFTLVVTAECLAVLALVLVLARTCASASIAAVRSASVIGWLL